MWKIDRESSTQGEASGFAENWYLGSQEWPGIKIEDERKLDYVELIGGCQGLPLGPFYIYGIRNQDQFYDNESFLFRGVILTSSRERESTDPKVNLDKKMPKRMVTILAETKELISRAAKILGLPLEEIV